MEAVETTVEIGTECTVGRALSADVIVEDEATCTDVTLVGSNTRKAVWRTGCANLVLEVKALETSLTDTVDTRKTIAGASSGRGRRTTIIVSGCAR